MTTERNIFINNLKPLRDSLHGLSFYLLDLVGTKSPWGSCLAAAKFKPYDGLQYRLFWSWNSNLPCILRRRWHEGVFQRDHRQMDWTGEGAQAYLRWVTIFFARISSRFFRLSLSPWSILESRISLRHLCDNRFGGWSRSVNAKCCAFSFIISLLVMCDRVQHQSERIIPSCWTLGERFQESQRFWEV